MGQIGPVVQEKTPKNKMFVTVFVTAMLISSNLKESLTPNFNTILNEVFCTKSRNKFVVKLLLFATAAANSYYNPLTIRVHPPVPASGD